MLICFLSDWPWQAYKEAIERAVRAQREQRESEVHALDLGCGTGFLSCCAAASGADSVVACDLHLPMCNLTRKVCECPFDGEQFHEGCICKGNQQPLPQSLSSNCRIARS